MSQFRPNAKANTFKPHEKYVVRERGLDEILKELEAHSQYDVAVKRLLQPERAMMELTFEMLDKRRRVMENERGMAIDELEEAYHHNSELRMDKLQLAKTLELVGRDLVGTRKVIRKMEKARVDEARMQTALKVKMTEGCDSCREKYHQMEYLRLEGEVRNSV
jgi:hypothetical protein